MPEGKSGPVLLCKVLLCCVFFPLGFVQGVITGLVRKLCPSLCPECCTEWLERRRGYTVLEEPTEPAAHSSRSARFCARVM